MFIGHATGVTTFIYFVERNDRQKFGYFREKGQT